MSNFKQTQGFQIIQNWMKEKGHEPFSFQSQTWERYHNNFSGMVVAPTGFGKTFSIFLAVVIDYLNHPNKYKKGLKLIWISPLRSLAKDLAKAMSAVVEEIGLDWEVAVRNGDTPTNVRRKQERLMPDVLLTTPETLHLLFSQKKNSRWFKNVACIAVDEWHELLGSKRGVLTELAIARIKKLSSKTRIWGISATIGNLEEAKNVLIPYALKTTMIRAKEKKKIEIVSVLPDEVDELSWAGHLGKKMSSKIIPIIYENNTTLIFTNTRNQSELWYQIIIEEAPDLIGQIAIHHGSIDKVQRNWIEEAISEGLLKAVVCTSSLDLGVDFKPVDCVIQIGSAKGIARFMQRAGRSGHSPFEVSKMYAVPTHSLQLIEVAAVKEAIKQNEIEARHPYVLTYDILVQFLVTLAVGEGFKAVDTFELVKEVHAFQYLTKEEFDWCIHFITNGGNTLNSYEEFHKVVLDDDGVYRVRSRRIAMMHRMNIGVIVGEVMMYVKFFSGGYIGMIEEFFISKLKKGDAFVLGGKVVEMQQIKDMTVLVKRSKKKKAITPSWLGGRLPLTSYLTHFLRLKLNDALTPNNREKELKFLHPLLKRQENNSHIPKSDEFLVEKIETKEGHHLFVYPFEGRLVHEIMASLIAYRISKIKKLTFTIAQNDYGFELYSDQPIPIEEALDSDVFSTEHLNEDLVSSLNESEMMQRRFRDIAQISGLVFTGYPGKNMTTKHLMNSTKLIYEVFREYDPNNLLLRQAYEEVHEFQLEEARMRSALERIANQETVLQKIEKPTPLAFPILVDRLRETMGNETLVERIKRMQLDFG